MHRKFLVRNVHHHRRVRLSPRGFESNGVSKEKCNCRHGERLNKDWEEEDDEELEVTHGFRNWIPVSISTTDFCPRAPHLITINDPELGHQQTYVP